MARYQYKARDEEGKIIAGVLGAVTEEEALKSLRERGYYPVSIQLVKEKRGGGGVFRFKKIRDEELIIFTRQLATLIEAGIPILSVLEIMGNEVDNLQFAKVIGEIREDIVAGCSISQALGKYPQFFPPLYVSFVHAGERGGVLEKVLARLGELLTHELENKMAIKSALRYPQMVVLAMIGAFIVITVFVIPKFANIFKATKMELPLPTRIMLGVNDFFQNFGFLLLGIVLIAGVLFIFWKRTGRGRLTWDKLKLKLPLVGSLLSRSMVSRFAFVFGSTVQSGMPILQVLEVSAQTLDNAYVARELENLKLEVREGKSIGETLSNSSVFPSLVSRMISVGERSGNLPSMLENLVSHYDTEVKYAIAGLTRALEQSLTVIMAGFVLLLALSVFLPMWNMVNLAKY